MTVQIRNAEMVDLLKADFQHRNEPNFAWRAACSMFMALPGLRGFWPMSAFNSLAATWDLSGNGRQLTYNGNPTYNAYDLAPYIDLDGTGDYLDRADEAGLDIIGNEAYVAAAIQGLTLGGWFWRDVARAQGMIGKFGVGTDAYRIYNNGGNTIRFDFFDAGVVGRTVDGTSAGTGLWEFIVGRFEPNNDELNITINGTETSAAVPVGTTIRNGTAPFGVGNIITNPLDGRASLCFLCVSSLPDVTLFSLYEQTRRLFYV